MTLFTLWVCCILSFSNFSVPPWMIFLLSRMAPENAVKGSSSSVFIWFAMFWCAFAIDSTSSRKTSKEDLREPNSTEPRGFFDRANSLRANSSSIAPRAVEEISDSPHADLTPVGTCVERLKLFARRFGIVHTLQHWTNTGILFAPEIVRNCPTVSFWRRKKGVVGALRTYTTEPLRARSLRRAWRAAGSPTVQRADSEPDTTQTSTNLGRERRTLRSKRDKEGRQQLLRY
jgi:hypothetical protein